MGRFDEARQYSYVQTLTWLMAPRTAGVGNHSHVTTYWILLVAYEMSLEFGLTPDCGHLETLTDVRVCSGVALAVNRNKQGVDTLCPRP